ncbi:unnamed protein product [Larinioides sclopetarius]|uniref:Uncharacterized protein n=1 Tax=Larinioides sclopetarius TaxID=280406 RepID=A0AAV1ZAL9_9ARAC
MPKNITRYKYKCLGLMCTVIVRHDKWIENCRKKHVFKFRNNIDINVKQKCVEAINGSHPVEKF